MFEPDVSGEFVTITGPMDSTLETGLPPDADRADTVRSLAETLGSDPSLLTDAAFEALGRIGIAISVKEVATGRYLHVNAALAGIFGRLAADFAGLSDAELMDPAQAIAIRGAEQSALAHSVPPTEQRIERGGKRRDFNVARVALRPSGSAPARFLLSLWAESTDAHQREIQLRQALAQLEQQQVSAEDQRRDLLDQNFRDGATGLYLRPHFDDQLRREIDLSSREHREFALVAIALDPLGAAAKARGEPARLRVLEAIGTLFRGNTRAMDASCRLDEDRFAILLSGVGLATAHSRMEGLRRQCATQIVVLEGRELGFTASMGVASFPHTAHTEEALLAAAENALREAQRRGGNHVALASIRFATGAD